MSLTRRHHHRQKKRAWKKRLPDPPVRARLCTLGRNSCVTELRHRSPDAHKLSGCCGDNPHLLSGRNLCNKSWIKEVPSTLVLSLTITTVASRKGFGRLISDQSSSQALQPKRPTPNKHLPRPKATPKSDAEPVKARGAPQARPQLEVSSPRPIDQISPYPTESCSVLEASCLHR